MAYKFVGTVKLAANKGYIEVVRSDAVKNGVEYDAGDDVVDLAKAAIGHAERLGLLIKAFVPEVEPAKKGDKGESLYKPGTLKGLQREPVVLKARFPLPFLAFLPAKEKKASNKPEGLGAVDGKAKAKPAKPAEPEGL